MNKFNLPIHWSIYQLIINERYQICFCSCCGISKKKKTCMCLQSGLFKSCPVCVIIHIYFYRQKQNGEGSHLTIKIHVFIYCVSLMWVWTSDTRRQERAEWGSLMIRSHSSDEEPAQPGLLNIYNNLLLISVISDGWSAVAGYFFKTLKASRKIVYL